VPENGYCQVVLAGDGRVLIERARWCDTFRRKLRGFTFRRALDDGEGLVLAERSEGRANTSIHMMFVFHDLGVVWVDGGGRVVDKVLARPWRLSYVPGAPAQYVIEGHPSILEYLEPGEIVHFRPLAAPG
jgi:uncharacterized membrane protein (UPF0127 family)